MNSESYSETQGSTSPQFALQGEEAVCTGDGFTVTARDWSQTKEDGLTAILSFRNGAADPIRDRVKLGLDSSRKKFIKQLPESYRLNFESILFALDDFLRTAEAKERASAGGGEIEWESGPYRIVNGATCWVKRSDAGETNVHLCNFSAKILSEELHDDGAEETRHFVIEGKLASNKPLPIARVAATSFASMGWPITQFGLDAVISAGPAVKDRLREAIQLRSEDATREHIFTHTGWREINGQYVFLTASGALGSTKPVSVNLGPDLARYQIPLEPENPVDAMRVSLNLLKVASRTITVPLWASMFRAPLASAFPLDLSVWYEGRSGSLKSTMTALFQCHYGAFDYTHLPGSWQSSANSLERRAFLLKDVPFPIDDYAPAGAGAANTRELESKAGRLLRSQGNLSGRGRLRADLSDRPTFAPRGLIIGTAEQRPMGESIVARTVLIEACREEVDEILPLLTIAQRKANRLPHAMAGYLLWLAPKMKELPALLKKNFDKIRTKISAEYAHLRIPGALAHLWLGFDLALIYAEEIGTCSSIEVQDLRQEGWQALIDVGRRQSRAVEEERPIRRFAEVLSSLLVQHRVTLLPKNEPHARFGEGAFLGWFDADWLYLMPEPTFKAISEFCRDSGELFPIRQNRLYSDLKEEGIANVDTGRSTATVSIDGTKRVLQLNIKRLETLGITAITAITANITREVHRKKEEESRTWS
jgi:hypothetical protein